MASGYSSLLSPEEREAEVIYTRALCAMVYGMKYSHVEACTDARALEARSQEAGKYLKWLLGRLHFGRDQSEDPLGDPAL